MAARIRTENSPPIPSQHFLPSKEKIFGCAIVIILAIGGLITAGIGLGGYLQAESLCKLSRAHSIIMMAAGVEGGSLLLIIGITGAVKIYQQKFFHIENKKASTIHKSEGSLTKAPFARIIVNNHDKETIAQTQRVMPKGNKGSLHADRIHSALSITRTAFIPPLVKGKIYGKEARAWEILNVKIVDVVPEAPAIDWDAYDPYFKESYRENYVLLYIPEKILVNGETKDFDAGILKKISKNTTIDIPDYLEPFLEKRGRSRWVLASTRVIPDSLKKPYKISTCPETQTSMIGDQGFRMAHALEATVLCLMVYHDSGKELFGLLTNPPSYHLKDPRISTRCVETCLFPPDDWPKPIRVGFESNGLKLSSTWQSGSITEGVIVVREVKSLYQIDS